MTFQRLDTLHWLTLWLYNFNKQHFFFIKEQQTTLITQEGVTQQRKQSNPCNNQIENVILIKRNQNSLQKKLVNIGNAVHLNASIHLSTKEQEDPKSVFQNSGGVISALLKYMNGVGWQRLQSVVDFLENKIVQREGRKFSRVYRSLLLSIDCEALATVICYVESESVYITLPIEGEHALATALISCRSQLETILPWNLMVDLLLEFRLNNECLIDQAKLFSTNSIQLQQTLTEMQQENRSLQIHNNSWDQQKIDVIKLLQVPDFACFVEVCEKTKEQHRQVLLNLQHQAEQREILLEKQRELIDQKIASVEALSQIQKQAKGQIRGRESESWEWGKEENKLEHTRCESMEGSMPLISHREEQPTFHIGEMFQQQSALRVKEKQLWRKFKAIQENSKRYCNMFLNAR